MTTTGDFFDIYGRQYGLVVDLLAAITAIDDHIDQVQTNVPSNVAQYAPGSEEREQMIGHVTAAIAVMKRSMERWCVGYVTDLMQTPTDNTVAAALEALDAYMIANNETLKQVTRAITSPVITQVDATNVGARGSCSISYANGNDETKDHARRDAVIATCITDRQATGVLGTEEFRVRGKRDPGNLDQNYHSGSGLDFIMRAVTADAAIEQTAAAGSSLARNGYFGEWTSLAADGWAATVGTYGTHLSEETTTVFRGTGSSLKIHGGTGLYRIEQALGDSSAGTSVKLSPRTRYRLSGNVIQDATNPPTAGVIRLSLRDGTDTLIGSAATGTLASSFDAINWAYFGVDLVTPNTIPDGAVIVLELTTGMTDATEIIYVDNVVLTPFYEPHEGGPSLAIIAGETPYKVGDLWTTGSGVTETTEASLIFAVDRMLDSYGAGVDLPVSGSPSNADSLIT